MNPTVIFNQNVIIVDPLQPTDEFLNFPPTVRHIQMVTNEKEIRDLQMLLEYKVIPLRMLKLNIYFKKKKEKSGKFTLSGKKASKNIF